LEGSFGPGLGSLFRFLGGSYALIPALVMIVGWHEVVL
jgi:hypothetical protein